MAEIKLRMMLNNLASVIDWKKGPTMTNAMYGNVHAVEIDGVIFIGGGTTDSSEDGYYVMAYNTELCYWRSTEPFSTELFTMVAHNNKLVLVGGKDENGRTSRELGQWESYDNSWTDPFPAMRIPRISPSVTSLRNFIIVAGGLNGNCAYSIEVLDMCTRQWSYRPYMPEPMADMKTTVIEGTWYFMGGRYDKVNYTSDVYSVFLESLVAQSPPSNDVSPAALMARSAASRSEASLWSKLPSLDTTNSCPVNMEGNLVAVGGKKVNDPKPLSFIQCYVPWSEDNKWSKIAELPHDVYDCTCIQVSDKIYLMGGSENSQTRYDSLFYSVIN